MPATALAQIRRDHPVNPGQGMIWRITRVAGIELLLLQSGGRVLAAVPATGRALLWAGDGELSAGEVADLLGMDLSKGTDSDQSE